MQLMNNLMFIWLTAVTIYLNWCIGKLEDRITALESSRGEG